MHLYTTFKRLSGLNGTVLQVDELGVLFENQNTKDKKIKDDEAGFKLKHKQRGMLAINNSLMNDRSVFMVTFNKSTQFDGKQFVIGELVEGYRTLYEMRKSTEEDKAIEFKIAKTGEAERS